MNATHRITWYYGNTELCRVVKDCTSLIEGTARLTGSMLIETHEGRRWISFGLWNAVKIEKVWREVPSWIRDH